jgi:hypothetical protein
MPLALPGNFYENPYIFHGTVYVSLSMSYFFFSSHH